MPNSCQRRTVDVGWSSTTHEGFSSHVVAQDFKEYGTEVAVKEAGKYRQEGKNYIVKEGDIIFFKFNVTTDKKK